MAKSKEQKKATLDSLESGLKAAKSAVFANFQGLTVADMEELRKSCRQENIQVLVAKKTLVKKAFSTLGLTGADPKLFQGGIATFIGSDEVTPARIVNTFAKTHEVTALFGGLLEGKFVDAAMVRTLANLPSKQQLLSQLVGSMNAPISGFVNVCAGTIRGLVNVLNAYKEKKA
ncbi:MAG: 50S ribosomal protein L10 [bacterium]|nr:50S ribosomal protein L10 [bacterium]